MKLSAGVLAEVIGDGGDHEQSFLVPRFERATKGRGRFSLLHSILIMPFVFYSHTIRYTTTHSHISPTIPQTPTHLSPSSPQVRGPLVRSRRKKKKEIEGGLEPSGGKFHQEEEERGGKVVEGGASERESVIKSASEELLSSWGIFVKIK